MSGAAPPGSEGASRPGANLAPAPDVQAVVAALQDEVARNRTAGAYPASLIEKLDSPFHPDEGLEPPEAHVVVESARPLRSTRPVVGAVTVFCKRVQRRLLSWYVAPIAQDQNRFNLAILRELRAIEQRVARLEGSPAPPPDEPDTESPRQGGS
jgi:hypothetical protein